MAAGGRGRRIEPTIVAAKMPRSRQDAGVMPLGTGMSTMRTAIPTVAVQLSRFPRRPICTELLHPALELFQPDIRGALACGTFHVSEISVLPCPAIGVERRCAGAVADRDTVLLCEL